MYPNANNNSKTSSFCLLPHYAQKACLQQQQQNNLLGNFGPFGAQIENSDTYTYTYNNDVCSDHIKQTWTCHQQLPPHQAEQNDLAFSAS